MPALPLDVAFVHMNRADARGNAQYLGPDFYFDDMFLMAAQKRFVSCEKLVETKDLLAEGSLHTLRINRTMVDGVIEAPGGAHFTECPPDYGRDESFQREYAASAKDEESWQKFKGEWLDISESEYQARLRGRGAR
jgi:glutaconate CoA-transferase subunit A